MAIEADLFEDQAEEFSRGRAIVLNKCDFGRNDPLYVSFDTCEQRDAAHRAYGPRCLNYGARKTLCP